MFAFKTYIKPMKDFLIVILEKRKMGKKACEKDMENNVQKRAWISKTTFFLIFCKI